MNSGVSVPKGAWVLVADHSKALLLKNNGTPVAPELVMKKVIEASDNPLTHEQGSDRPGRAYSSTGSHRSAVEETDFHAVAGQRFLEHVATRIEKTLTDEEDFEALVVVAPPRALSELRDALSDRLKASVVGEVDKDLTGMPVAEIAEHLAA